MMSQHSPMRQGHRTSTFESHIHRETSESYYEVQEYVPSSPFLEEADATQRIPLRASTPNRQRSPIRGSPSLMSPKSQLRDNEGLTRAIEFMAESDKENLAKNSTASFKSSSYDPDETCMSAFSMVPTADVTRLTQQSLTPAKRSPTKSPAKTTGALTPRSSRPGSPRTGRIGGVEPSPTPKRPRQSASDEGSTQLLDFTEQLNYAALHSPSRRSAAYRSPAKGESANLLDFDLPPIPTPRSLPTITARELENLKVEYLTQISSLKATIDGKDATLKSLVEAKDDAERRGGETAEKLRGMQDSNNALKEEKADWERRDTEVGTILRNVKSELVEREKERDQLAAQVDESERLRLEAEGRAQEAEARAEEARAEQQQNTSAEISTPSASQRIPSRRDIDLAVENVTRELHNLYKQKHEAKVTALKKSYERRWEKRIQELQGQIEDLTRENDDLRVGRDATMSNVVPSVLAKPPGVDVGTEMSPSRAQQMANVPESGEGGVASMDSTAQLEQLTAQVTELQGDIEAERDESQKLRKELETSRAENSDLVAVVEEMLQLEPGATAGPETPTVEEAVQRPASRLGRVRSNSGADGLRASVSEHTGTRMTGGAGLSVPKVSGMGKSGFGYGGSSSKIGGLNRSTSGSRSGIMSNIERMGRGRAAE